MGDDQGGVPVGGEGGVFGAAFGEGGAVAAEHPAGVADVAGTAEFAQERGVFERLGAGERADSGIGHLAQRANDLQLCKVEAVFCAGCR